MAPAGRLEDPTNIAQRNGFQYDYLTAGSGIGNMFVNAKWLYKISGMYQLPANVNVSAFYNARQGYPFERTVTSPSRANGAGTVSLLLDNIGDSRLPTYQNLDFHVERPIKIGNRADRADASTSSTCSTRTRSRRSAARRTARTRTSFRRSPRRAFCGSASA